jgi:hypothetical protein
MLTGTTLVDAHPARDRVASRAASLTKGRAARMTVSTISATPSAGAESTPFGISPRRLCKQSHGAEHQRGQSRMWRGTRQPRTGPAGPEVARRDFARGSAPYGRSLANQALGLAIISRRCASPRRISVWRPTGSVYVASSASSFRMAASKRKNSASPSMCDDAVSCWRR